PEPTRDQDAVRMAACGPPATIARRLAAGTGRQRDELKLAVRAWRTGGAVALTVLDGTWAPSPEEAARAQAALASAWEPSDRPRLRALGVGHWSVETPTGAAVGVRLGPDGRFWPCREEDGRWVPAGPAASCPAVALAEM
ncbi:SWF or SNF family helicase, partial [Streptomyces sp. NPDC057638]